MARIGEILNGRYKIMRELGHGGTSVVYLAEDQCSGERCAVKEFKKGPEQDQNIQEEVRAQGDILKELSHPAIPRFRDRFEDGSACYLVTEYLLGMSLDKVVAEQGPLPQNTVLDIGIQICDVLEYLHCRPQPIVYCDLKPSNIMFRREGMPQVSLFDFGIAVKNDGHERPIKAKGTKGFAAPEQFTNGGTVDARADVYGLGATLYNLVTGERPLDRCIYPITCWDGALSDKLEKLILRCTDIEPDKRYESCAEIKNELRLCGQSGMVLSKGEALDSYPAEKCSSCAFSPASCAPRQRRGMSRMKMMTFRGDEPDPTQDLDATEVFDFAGQIDIDTILFEAKRSIHFQPLLKILKCDSDDAAGDSTAEL